MATTIQIEEKVKSKLDKLKVHPRESYNQLIEKMADRYNFDEESLQETIEILSDPEAMRELAEAIDCMNKGKGKSLEQFRKELKL